MNTNLIISTQLGFGDDGADYAASVCSEYFATTNGKTYGDWYLPSYQEVEMMRQNASFINTTSTNNGGSSLSTSYWSSTEVNASTASYAFMSVGIVLSAAKNQIHAVRAVRAF